MALKALRMVSRGAHAAPRERLGKLESRVHRLRDRARIAQLARATRAWELRWSC